MRAFTTCLALAVLMLVTGTSRTARADDEFNRRGAFVGGGASYGFEGFQGATGRADFGDSWGYNLHGGYRFNEILAAEVVHEYFDDFGASFGGRAHTSVRSAGRPTASSSCRSTGSNPI